MNSHHSNKEQFLNAEASIGITRQNYQKKYVYDPNHPSENFILDRLIPTPSQLQGLTIEEEKAISYIMGEIIFRAAESLQLPVSTAVVSASLAHFYFSRVSFIEQDFRDIAMGSMFLACRSEQTIRRSGQISAVFDHVFKIFEGQKMPIKIQIFQSTEYVYMKDKVVEGEKKILFELGFEIHRLLDIPHRYIGGLFTSFDRHPQSKKICQTAWKHLNDFYRTNVCVYYPGQIIAAAAVYLSLIKLNIKMPPVAWWTLLEANIDCIQELIGQLEYFYQTSKQSKYTMDWVAQQLTEVGNRHDLVNVFPINYYRKIMLDLSSQLRVNKSMLQAQQQMMNALQKTEKQEKSRSRERQTEKKKKKDKKKKDKKKKKDRGGSSERNIESENQSAILKDQKNHEDTPLRKNTENANESSQLEVEKSQGLEEYPKKQAVQKLKVEDPKSLLSRIHEQIQQRKKQIKQASSSSDSDQDSEDEAAIALLRQKKKQNQAKKQA